MAETEQATEAAAMQETALQLEQALGRELDALKVERVAAGVFFTGVVLNSGHAGMAFTPIGEMPEAVCCPRTASRMPQAGKLAGKGARELLPWAHDGNVLKAAMGVAALNALSHYLFEEKRPEGFSITSDTDAVEGTALTPEDQVVLVGALVPYIRMLKEKGCSFSILERTPDPLKDDELDHYVPPEGAQEAVSRASLVIATGATLVNGSIDRLLGWAPHEARIIVVGPTASMLPHALFNRGVDVLGGVRITDPQAAMRIMIEGGSGYHMFGVCAEKISISKN
jgi:uncharacterized protein (DUF4213/DUF364 family)